MDKIVITGGCGFVGSNICVSLRKAFPNMAIIAFDNLKRRGSELNIERLKEYNVSFVHGDVRIADDFEPLGVLDLIIDASAEPSVLAGLDDGANYLVHTNYIGTLNCLNYAKRHKAAFIFLSTSRVYSVPALESIHYTIQNDRFVISPHQQVAGVSPLGISEQFPTDGYRSLYGSTKLGSELLINEYAQSFGLKAIINRCGVIAGPYQMGKVDQGVVVLWMARHFWKRSLSYIGFGGEGLQVRDMLHIDDLCSLIIYQINHLSSSHGYTANVGGGSNCSASLKELTQYCAQITGNTINISSESTNRPADIPIFVTDNSKIHELTGWQPQMTVHKVLEDIYDWLDKDQGRLKAILN